MQEELDYLNEQVEAPALPDIMEAVTLLRKQRQQVADLEDLLAEAKRIEDKLSMEIVPNILDNYETPISRIDLDTPEGRVTVSVQEDVRASIPKDPARRASALSWLSEQGAGSLIKDVVTIEDPTKELLDFLDQGVSYARSRDVNAASLAAWFREKFGIKKNTVASMSVADVSEDVSCFRYRKTTIKGGN